MNGNQQQQEQGNQQNTYVIEPKSSVKLIKNAKGQYQYELKVVAANEDIDGMMTELKKQHGILEDSIKQPK